MSDLYPEVTDMESLREWIRVRGFDPDEYADWDYAEDGPPPWAECEFVGDGWVYRWPMICTERRIQGVVTMGGSDE